LTRPDYYEHNAEAYARRTGGRRDADALERFAELARPPADAPESAPRALRVLDLGCGAGGDLAWFAARGHVAEGLERCARLAELATARASSARVRLADARLAKLPREGFDAVWANRFFPELDPVGAQRTLIQLFASLRPRGVLFASLTEGEGVIEDRADNPAGPARTLQLWRSEAFAALLRQSGFNPVLTGRDLRDPSRLAFFCRRV
jgi:SAM-dependent methyltransferase